jgi:hypothetical protein
MRSHVRGAALAIAIAAGTVTAGVAANQVLDDGKLTWTWAYLAFGFTLLVALIAGQVAQQPGQQGLGATQVRRRTYLKQLRSSVTHMETVGVRTQGEYALKMRQVYVDVALRPKPAHETAPEPGVGHHVPEPVGERRSLLSFLAVGRAYAVIGSPGSGKTTLARHTALSLCAPYRRFWDRRFWRRRRLPILLYLRDHAAGILQADDSAPDLASVAAEAGWLHGKVPASWLKGRLDRGRCVVLLDGLDEVADEEDRKKVVAWVRRQIERYPANTYVVTSRPHGYLSNPIPSTDVLQVQRFTIDQASRFLHHWYYAIECRAQDRSGKHVRASADDKAADLLRRLRDKPALYDLAANPLLLTMIANVHRYRGALPGSRADLYGEMCDALLHRRQEDRNLTDATGLRGPQKERVVRHLALHMMRERLRDIPIGEARRVIRRPLRQVGRDRQITPDLFLDEVTKSGLLVEREHGVYGFAHLTFQEYLTATQIRHQPESHSNLLVAVVADPWWRETILLWAAAVDATPVIEACLASGTIGALTLAFDCAEEALEVDPDTLDRLGRLLETSPESERPAQEYRKLIAAVTASRNLRSLMWLDDATAACARPVSATLYTSFATDEATTEFHARENVATDLPAVGMEAEDTVHFITWLNDLFDDGTAYRLPTPQEVTQITEKLPDFSRNTIWTTGDNIPRLHRPEDAAWPYAPTRDQIADFTSTSQKYTADLTNFIQDSSLGPSFDLPRFLAYLELHTTAPPRSPSLSLLVAADLARIFDFPMITASGTSPEEFSTLASLFEATAGLAAVLRQDHSSVTTHDLAAVHDFILSGESTSTGEVISRVHSVHALAYEATRNLAHNVGDHPLATALEQDLNEVSTLALDSVTDSDVLQFHRETLTLAHRIMSEGTRHLSERIVLFGAPSKRLGIIADHLVPPQNIGLLAAATFARDFADKLGSNCQRLLPVMTVATATLIRFWASPPSTRRLGVNPRRPFNQFVADVVAAHDDDLKRSTENPLQVLRQVQADLHYPDFYTSDEILTKDAFDLIEPIVTRKAPADHATLFVAAFALVAAIAHLRDTGQREVACELARVLGTLITLAYPESGPPRNQILLLVRA